MALEKWSYFVKLIFYKKFATGPSELTPGALDFTMGPPAHTFLKFKRPQKVRARRPNY